MSRWLSQFCCGTPGHRQIATTITEIEMDEKRTVSFAIARSMVVQLTTSMKRVTKFRVIWGNFSSANKSEHAQSMPKSAPFIRCLAENTKDGALPPDWWPTYTYDLGVGYARHKAFNLILELRSPSHCDDCGFSFFAVDSSVSNPVMRRGGACGGR